MGETRLHLVEGGRVSNVSADATAGATDDRIDDSMTHAVADFVERTVTKMHDAARPGFMAQSERVFREIRDLADLARMGGA